MAHRRPTTLREPAHIPFPELKRLASGTKSAKKVAESALIRSGSTYDSGSLALDVFVHLPQPSSIEDFTVRIKETKIFGVERLSGLEICPDVKADVVNPQ
jgi:hypothetical protein